MSVMSWKRIAMALLIGTAVMTVIDLMQLVAYYMRVKSETPPGFWILIWTPPEWAARLLVCVPAIYLAHRSYFANAIASVISSVASNALAMIFILPQAAGVGQDIWNFSMNVNLFYFMIQKYLLPTITLYWLALAGMRAWVYHQRMTAQTSEAAELERRNITLRRRLEEARYAMLKSRVHPHFIFNTLNAITILARARRSHAVTETSARLNKLLRATVDADTPVCTVKEELKLVKDYLFIERVRFGKRLSVKWRIDPGALDLVIPRFSIQPMVDNAVKHGVGRTTAPVQIEIGVRVRAGRAHIWVQDDGAGVSGTLKFGFGLTSVQAMLNDTFGDSYRCSFQPADRGVRAEFSFPVTRPAS